MQKIIGIVCILIGLWFLYSGYNIDHSVGSGFTKTFTGSPLSSATHNYIAGAIFVAAGVFLGFLRGKKA